MSSRSSIILRFHCMIDSIVWCFDMVDILSSRIGIFNVPTIWLWPGLINLIVSLPYWSFRIWTCSFNAHYHPNYHQVIGISSSTFICIIIHTYIPSKFNRKYGWRFSRKILRITDKVQWSMNVTENKSINRPIDLDSAKKTSEFGLFYIFLNLCKVAAGLVWIEW